MSLFIIFCMVQYINLINNRSKMKNHKTEHLIFTISIIATSLFIALLPIRFISADLLFVLLDSIPRMFYFYGSTVAPIVIAIILIRRKKRGHKSPLSIEAFRYSKSSIPSKIYKYCYLTTDTNNELDHKKLSSLENQQIWTSSCSALNDPFEGQFEFFSDDINNSDNPIIKTYRETFKHESDGFILSSFSCNYDSILMWGHYANACRGYCIEYTVNSKEYLFAVQYLDKRLLLSSPTFEQNVYDNYNEYQENFDKIDDDAEKLSYMMYVLSMKSNLWKYEEEIRVITKGEPGNIDSDMMGLIPSKLIIGYQCSYKDELINIA